MVSGAVGITIYTFKSAQWAAVGCRG